MDAKLVVVGGDGKEKEVRLALPTIIGRGKDCKLRLQQALVSRQHCEIYEDSGTLMVRDLGSLNGTFINNEKITEAALPAGELLTVGSVTFRAVYGKMETSPAGQMGKTAAIGKTLATDSKSSAAKKTKAAKSANSADAEKANADEKQRAAAPASASSDSMSFDLNDVDEVEVFDDASGVLPPSALPKDGFQAAPAQAFTPFPAAAAGGANAANPQAPFVPGAGPPGAATPGMPDPNAAAAKADEQDDDLQSFLKSLGK